MSPETFTQTSTQCFQHAFCCGGVVMQCREHSTQRWKIYFQLYPCLLAKQIIVVLHHVLHFNSTATILSLHEPTNFYPLFNKLLSIFLFKRLCTYLFKNAKWEKETETGISCTCYLCSQVPVSAGAGPGLSYESSSWWFPTWMFYLINIICF